MNPTAVLGINHRAAQSALFNAAKDIAAEGIAYLEATNQLAINPQEIIKLYVSQKTDLQKFTATSKIKIITGYLAAEKVKLLEPLITKKREALESNEDVKKFVSTTDPIDAKPIWKAEVKILENNLRSRIEDMLIPLVVQCLEKEISSEGSCTIS